MAGRTRKSSGMFITFEGGEGAGKTTQIRKLAEYLQVSGKPVVLTREPGGTPEAEKIRDLLVQRDGGNWSPMAECLLLYAARIMHTDNVIRPALAEGKIVLCDRYADSTLAYQGYASNLPLEDIARLERLCLRGFEPNITFIFDIDPVVGLERAGRRLAAVQDNSAQTEDRFEQRGLSFHQKLREGFLSIAAKNRKRCVVLDAVRDVDMIASDILKIMNDRLGL